MRSLICFVLLFSLVSCEKVAQYRMPEYIAPEAPEEIVVVPDRIDKTVAVDGTGDYTTVQAAIDAAPNNSKEYYLIAIKNGIYKEVLTIPKNKNYIYFKGEDSEKTVLTFDNYASKLNGSGAEYGTSGSASVFVKGDYFKAENLTFENTSGIDAGQALAISIEGNYSAFNKCRFLGFQDTYYAGNKTIQYLKECYIAGTVDFMFGNSTAVFDKCTIHSLRNGYITAASTEQDQKYGYVYLNCKLTSVVGMATVHLGRPWRPYANVVFISCEMGAHIKPEGWNNWGNVANEATAFYAEYKSTGAGYKPGERQPWSKQLTDVEAKEYTLEKILGTWKPF